jgi:pimeloyl-ACP methyl ester carboxylesterase
MSAPIILVHGAFCGGWGMEPLAKALEGAGRTVLAPDLRGHGPEQPRDAAAGLSMSDYAADIADLARSLPQAPVLVGHSMGGLVCALAARKAPVAAVVLFSPSPPWGVAGYSMEEAVTAFGVQMMSPVAGVLQPDLDLMRAFSVNRLRPREREAVLQRLRPESGRALRETLTWWLDPFMTTSIGPGPLQAPTLVFAGGEDRVHTEETVRRTAERLGGELRVLKGMSHWPFREPGGEGLAGEVLAWLDRAGRAAA